jgi:hypothetical protein
MEQGSLEGRSPILGFSEGDRKKEIIKNEYTTYIKGEMERFAKSLSPTLKKMYLTRFAKPIIAKQTLSSCEKKENERQNLNQAQSRDSRTLTSTTTAAAPTFPTSTTLTHRKE